MPTTTRSMLAPEERERLRGARVALLGELCATVVHDVLQPISASMMRGHAALRWLRGDRPNVPEAIAAIERMMVDADRAIEVVTRFRALASDAPAAPEMLVLNTLVRDCLTWLDHELDRHYIALELDVPATDMRLLGERVPLQQVMVNVLMNAIQAMSPASMGNAAGGACNDDARLLRVRLARIGREAEITVQDTGPGLSDAVMARMFDAFYTTRPEGMGMGLAICQTILHAHGGQIHAERPSEGGARIVMRLPLLAMS